jgi:hypothetical protein
MKKPGEGGRKDEKVGEQEAGEKAREREIPKDFVEVRKNFANEVRLASNEILGGLIAGAKGGQVAAAKYLFEVVGVYPVNEETLGKPEESIVYSLYKRLVEAHPSVVEIDTEAGAERVRMAGGDEERSRSDTAGGGCEREIPELSDKRPRPEDAVE